MCSYCREIFKFHDFMNTFKKFREICFVRNFAKILYQRNLQIMCFKMIYKMFIF